MANVRKAFKAFRRSRQSRSLSNASLVWYDYALRPFVARFGDRKMKSITADTIQRYIIRLQKQTMRFIGATQKPEQEGGLRPQTIRGRVRALRVFFNWYWNVRHLPPFTNPMKQVKSPPQPPLEPSAIDPADVVRMLEACADTPIGRRDRAMIAFLAETGARSGGMLGLTMDNLDMAHERARVHEKGQRSRFVSLPGYAAWAMGEWLAVRPVEATTVFCALLPAHYARPLTNSGLRTALTKIAKRAGVEGKFNAHSFRHGFGVHLAMQGVSLAAVSKMLGHSTVVVTNDYYLRFSPEQLDELHRQASPLKGLTPGNPDNERR